MSRKSITRILLIYHRHELLDLMYTCFTKMCPGVHFKKCFFFHPCLSEIRLVKDRRIMSVYLKLVRNKMYNEKSLQKIA
jgi:hypothetical protein